MIYERKMALNIPRLGRRDAVVAVGGLVIGAAVATAAAFVWPAPTTKPAALDPPLRTNEILLSGPRVSIGHLTYQPLRMACGLSEVVGSHAELAASGQFCEVRGAVGNVDAVTHDWNSRQTALTTTDGRSFPVSEDAMGAKRQPEVLTIGAAVRYEFDVYFSVPLGETVQGMTIQGSEGGLPVTVPLPVRSWPLR
jgi:hypothetical protein